MAAASGRRRHHHQGQPVERAGGPRDGRAGDLGVAGGGREVAVAEQHLDDADVGAALQQVGGEAVPQGVHGIFFVNPEYGERLGDIKELEATYARIGDFMKQECGGYCFLF